MLPPCAASTLDTAEWHVSTTGMEGTSAPPVGLGLIIMPNPNLRTSTVTFVRLSRTVLFSPQR